MLPGRESRIKTLEESVWIRPPDAPRPALLRQLIKSFVWVPRATARLGFKEVIQPQVPLRLPCYDFTPVMNHSVVIVPLAVRLTTSGATHSHGVTGGVYKARERIHRDILIRDY